MKPQSQRLLSLDTLRGFDMLFIMGFSGLVISICKLFPGGADCWLAQTMNHVDWHGLAHHDTIFPLFLFIAGVSFPFSYAKQIANGIPQSKIYLKIFKRMLILIGLGIVYNGFFKGALYCAYAIIAFSAVDADNFICRLISFVS